MPNWFDQFDVGHQPYEQGGIAGPAANAPIMNSSQVAGGVAGAAGADGNVTPAGWDPAQWAALSPEQRQQGTTMAPPTNAQPTNGNPGMMPNGQPAQSGNVGHDGTFGGMNREQWRDAWMGAGSMTPQAADSWLSSHGASQVNGHNGTWTTPYGETLDLQGGRSGALDHGGTIRPIFGGGGHAAAAPAGAPGGGAPAMAPAPTGGGMPAPGGAGYSGHLSTRPDAFTWQNFDPNSVDVTKDPGYAFRMAEDQKAMQNSAAAKGNLLTGGFAKALQDRSQAMASQEYGSAFNRALGVNQANNQGGLSTFTANTNADLGYGNLDLGNKQADNSYSLGQGQLALGNRSADQSYDLGLRNNALGYTQAGNSFALGQGQLGLGWANHGLQAQGQNFNQGYSLAQLGLQAGNVLAGGAQNYGAQGANAITGGGNAAAAGAIGSGNAWGNAFSGVGNAAAQGYYMSQGYGGF